MARKSHRKGKASRRRNLVIITMILLGFIGLIAAVNILSARQTLILPEIQAERALLRNDPEKNAYFDIAEAATSSQPARPLSLLVPDPYSPGSQMEFKPLAGSVPELMGVKRPLDDELTLKYIEDTAYLIPIVDRASTKQYCLGPMQSHIGSIEVWRESYGFYWINGTYLGHAFYKIQNGTEVERGFEMLENALRLRALDGERYSIWNFRGFYTGLQYTYGNSDDPALRQRIRSFVTSLPTPFTDMDHILNQGFAAIDETLLSPTGYEHSIPIGSRINLFALRQIANRMTAEMPKLREIAQTHPVDWSPLIDEHWIDVTRWKGVNEEAWHLVLSPLHYAHWANAQFEAMPIMFAMEDWRRDHGSYAESLDQLVPDYLEAVPVSSYTRGPYRLNRQNYTLNLEENWDLLPKLNSGLYHSYRGFYASFQLEEPEE